MSINTPMINFVIHELFPIFKVDKKVVRFSLNSSFCIFILRKKASKPFYTNRIICGHTIYAWLIINTRIS